MTIGQPASLVVAGTKVIINAVGWRPEPDAPHAV